MIVQSKYNKVNPTIANYIPRNVRIIDVGCDTGLLGEYIKKNKSPRRIVGIDNNKKALSQARKIYDAVFERDLNENISLSLRKKFYDCIVFADILEHLHNPSHLLQGIKHYLSDDGIIIVSVPNVVFFVNRLKILSGNFSSTETGIMDKTHLHFYTKTKIESLISKSGYKIHKSEGYINTRPALSFMNTFARHVPTLFAYQFLVIASKK